MSEQPETKVNLIQAMDDISNAVAVINGIKAGLVNEGWDPINAESAVVAMLRQSARP